MPLAEDSLAMTRKLTVIAMAISRSNLLRFDRLLHSPKGMPLAEDSFAMTRKDKVIAKDDSPEAISNGQ
jgi:hypothetical protein